MASVSNALAKLDDVDVVLIHDSARPETPVEVFERVAALVEKTGDGVVPVLPTVDTTVIVEEGVITEAVDRDTLFRVQTPQGFPAAEYRSAISATLGNFTDDASVFWPTRSRRQQHPICVNRNGLLNAQLVIAVNDRISPEFTEILHQVVDE